MPKLLAAGISSRSRHLANNQLVSVCIPHQFLVLLNYHKDGRGYLKLRKDCMHTPRLWGCVEVLMYLLCSGQPNTLEMFIASLDAHLWLELTDDSPPG